MLDTSLHHCQQKVDIPPCPTIPFRSEMSDPSKQVTPKALGHDRFPSLQSAFDLPSACPLSNPQYATRCYAARYLRPEVANHLNKILLDIATASANSNTTLPTNGQPPQPLTIQIASDIHTEFFENLDQAAQIRRMIAEEEAQKEAEYNDGVSPLTQDDEEQKLGDDDVAFVEDGVKITKLAYERMKTVIQPSAKILILAGDIGVVSSPTVGLVSQPF